MGNWFATVLGIITGVPIALWVNKRFSDLEEKKKVKEADEKNIKILKLLRQELIFNQGRLVDRKADKDALQRHPFQIDVWEAFSDSGEIKWIKNYDLINSIASAYSIVKIVIRLEQTAFNASKGAFAFAGTEQALKSILEEARNFDIVLENNLNAALKYISTEIGQN